MQIHYTAGTPDPHAGAAARTLDWEMWCGPAPKLPYSPAIGHKAWRLEEAYGNGHLVDWGIHLIDATRMMLGWGMPKSVTAVGGLYEYKGQITTPDTLTAHFEFEHAPWSGVTASGARRSTAPELSNGICFFGEKETVFVNDNRWMVMSRAKDAARGASWTSRHQADPGADRTSNGGWLDAVRRRRSRPARRRTPSSPRPRCSWR